MRNSGKKRASNQAAAPQKRESARGGAGQRRRAWPTRAVAYVLSLMTRREEFDDAPGQTPTSARAPTDFTAGSPRPRGGERAHSASSPTEFQKRIVGAMDSLRVPVRLQRLVFYPVDFLTSRRVLAALVLVLLAVLAGLVYNSNILNDVMATFIVEEENRPGKHFFRLYNDNKTELPHRQPVAIIPGFITGALELWESDVQCMRDNALFASTFRARMFGPQMLYLLLRDPHCWLQLFAMDRSGADPPRVRVRPDMGFTSVDYFVPGYWVWAKVLLNLGDIGYDPQSMAVLTYDWRLSPQAAHARDGLFYQIRNNIKFLCQKNRNRAVVISHSYGTTVALAFFRWVEQREPGWMDRYVSYYINVGGTTMGLPKALSAVLMGDVRDTLSVPRPARRLLNSFLSQPARFNFLRTWSCLVAMLPRGCSAAFDGVLRLANGTRPDNRGVATIVADECRRSGHESCVRAVEKHLRDGVDRLPSLPQAPHTTVVCFYGVSKRAEVGYHLENVSAPDATAEAGVLYNTNTSHTDGDVGQGVRLGDGDGTVPLDSLAYMCRAPNGWRRNVGRVVTIEHSHEATGAVSPLNLRGGVVSGDHVDILGNYELLEAILKIASGMDRVAREHPERDLVVHHVTPSGDDARNHRAAVLSDDADLPDVTAPDDGGGSDANDTHTNSSSSSSSSNSSSSGAGAEAGADGEVEKPADIPSAAAAAGEKMEVALAAAETGEGGAAAVGRAGSRRMVLRRSVRDRIISDIDERIATGHLHACTVLPNVPITPKELSRDEFEFL